MTDEKIIEWLDELCEAATNEARGGDMALVNRIGGNPALNYYFANVNKMHAMSAKDYASTTHMIEARRVYNSYQADLDRETQEKARDAKVQTLEGKLDELLQLVNKLTEGGLVPAKKSAKKPAKQDEIDSETEAE